MQELNTVKTQRKSASKYSFHSLVLQIAQKWPTSTAYDTAMTTENASELKHYIEEYLRHSIYNI